MKTLFITTSLPHLRATGAEVATSNFIDAIKASGNEVVVLGYLRPGDRAPDDASQFENVREWPIELKSAGLRVWTWLARSIFTGKPFISVKFCTKAMRNAITHHLRVGRYDQIVIDHSQMGWVLDIPGLPAKRVFIAHNFENGLYGQMAERETGLRSWIYARDARLIAKVEKRLVLETCQTWTLTSSEAEAFNKLSGTQRASNFDLPGPDLALDLSAPTPSNKRDIGILGAWTWEVNRVGIEWFLRDVVPLLNPKIRIGIAGRGTEGMQAPSPNVTFYGFVNDAGEFLRASRVVALPTIAGAGVQLKTIASIASGATVVGTPLSFRGIEDIPDSAVCASQDAAGFARALSDVLAKPARKEEAARGLAWFRERKTRFESRTQTCLADL